MSADDMIRRGDALALFSENENIPTQVARDAIAALPTVTVGVRPLKFEQVYAEFHAAETPFGPYEVWGDYWRSPFTKKTEQSADPVAAAQTDFDARILAALEPQPAPDAPVEIDMRAVMMERIEEAASQSPWVPAEYSMSEVVSDCCAFLREPRQPAPDAAAIREATARLHKLAYWLDTDAEVLADMDQRDLSDHQHIQAEVNAILALIQKGGA